MHWPSSAKLVLFGQLVPIKPESVLGDLFDTNVVKGMDTSSCPTLNRRTATRHPSSTQTMNALDLGRTSEYGQAIARAMLSAAKNLGASTVFGDSPARSRQTS